MTLEEYLEIKPFIKHFCMHFDLLMRRYERFKEIDDPHNTDIDVITYLDMIIVQLRAMCIESSNLKNNYTAQNLLRKVGKQDLAEKIDAMLNETFYAGRDYTIREALKKLADKLICHYDNFDGEHEFDLAVSDILMNNLRNPYEDKNLKYIMDVLTSCVYEGLYTKFFNEEETNETTI